MTHDSGDRDLARTATANLLLHALTTASKVGLVVLLVFVLEPAALGLFGLVAASVSFGAFALGFDFHAFATREILAADAASRRALVRDQAIFLGLAYSAGLPISMLLFILGILPWTVLGGFLAVLITEHLAMEAQRLLVTIGRSTSASFLNFLRGGAWVWVLALLAVLSPELLDLMWVLRLWAIGAGTAVLIGALRLAGELRTARTEASIDWLWIRTGIRIAIPFVVGTLAIRGILTVDRYALDALWGNELVGVYTLYFGAFAAVYGLTEAAVHYVMRPGIIEAYQAEQTATFHRRLLRFAVASTAVSLALALGAGFAGTALFHRLPDPLYGQYMAAYYALLAGAVALVLSGIPDVVLYCRRADRALGFSAVAGLVVAALLHLILVADMGILGTALSTCAGLSVVGLTKATFALSPVSR